jgi:hypothetical protein
MLSAFLYCANIDQQTCDSYRSMALTSVRHSKLSLVTLAGGATGMHHCEGFSPRRDFWASTPGSAQSRHRRFQSIVSRQRLQLQPSVQTPSHHDPIAASTIPNLSSASALALKDRLSATSWYGMGKLQFSSAYAQQSFLLMISIADCTLEILRVCGPHLSTTLRQLY